MVSLRILASLVIELHPCGALVHVLALAGALARIPEPIAGPGVAQVFAVGVATHATTFMRQVDLSDMAILLEK
jgi:hypothetical protein